mgnify:FL=1
MISLPESLERRNSVSEQFSKLDIEFKFFDAVDGRIDSPELINIEPFKFLLRNNRYPVPGEVGCYTSHWMLWRRCYECGQPILIMEDDFEFSAEAQKVLSNIDRLSQDFPILKLEKTIENKVVKSVEFCGGIKVLHYKRAPNVLMAYLVTPAAAEKLLQGRERFYYPVDVYMRNSWLHGVPVRGVDPPLVTFGEWAAQDRSMIGPRSPHSPWWAKIPRLYYKNRNTVMTHLHNYLRR